jgi:predicted choloylglycine hydrolase
MNNRLSKFRGTHKEIGRQVGEQYKKWGKKDVYIPAYADSYYPQQLKIYKKYFPLYIEYLEGIALGLNLPKDKVLISYLTGFLTLAHLNPPYKCSTFAIKNKNDILIGRNYDWLESSEKISSLVNYEYTDKTANSFIGITDMATWKMGKPVPQSHFVIMIDDAWNDQGLYIALNGAPGKKTNIGMCTTHAIQCVVEKCTTTEEAVALITEIPINNSKIFTIADRKGNFAVVEKSLEKGTYVRKAKDLIFTTNHYNHPKLTLENLSIFPDIPFHSTFARYHYLEYNLMKEKDNLDLNKIVSILNKPPARQNWRGIDQGDVMTIWTYGLNLTNGKYLLEFAPILKEKVIVSNE